MLTFNSFYFVGYVQVAKGGQGPQECRHIRGTLEALGRWLDALAVIDFQVDNGSVWGESMRDTQQRPLCADSEPCLLSLTHHQWEVEGGNPSPCFPVAQALQLPTLLVYLPQWMPWNQIPYLYEWKGFSASQHFKSTQTLQQLKKCCLGAFGSFHISFAALTPLLSVTFDWAHREGEG